MKAHHLVFSLGIVWQCHIAAAETNALDPAQFQYNIKTTVEAYDRIGRTNSAWDAEARRCLTTFARVRSWTNGYPSNLISELRTNLSVLGDLKCNDPMVRYLYARFVYPRSHSKAEYSTEAAAVASELRESQYPDIRKFYAVMFYRQSLLDLNPQQPEAASLLETAASYLAKALKDVSMGPREADQACDVLLKASWWPEPTRWKCYHALEPALTNGWPASSFALLAKGRGYLSYAWEARGNGYANTVSGSGWNLLGQRLDIAADSLEAAWKLDSNDIRICQEMMNVELGQGKGPARLELWFQRGMKLDPGNYELCDQKLEYLRPRWYGSIEQMIAFGRECTTNANWKGSVRLMLADAHYKATTEIQDDSERAAYWKRPAVWEDIHYTFEQFFKLYPDEVGYRHNYARYAVRCGQWEEFERQIKLFPSTNYAYFGGVDKFNNMVRTAEKHLKKP